MRPYLDIIHGRLSDALERFDLIEVQHLFSRAAAMLAPRDLALKFVPGLLTEIGDRWGRDELCVAQEHAVSVAVRNLLGQLLVSARVDARWPAAVAVTPVGERHEFGAMIAAVLTSLSGWRAVYLGAELPAEEIALAVRRSGARVLLVSAVAMEAEALVREISAIRAALPAVTELLVGGAAAYACRARLGDASTHVTDAAGLESYLVGSPAAHV